MNALLLCLSPNFIDEYYTVQYGISLWSAEVSCPGCIPSQPLAHSQPPGSVRKTALVLCGACSAANMRVWYQHPPRRKCKAQHYEVSYVSFKPGRPTTARKVIFPWRGKGAEKLSLQRQKIEGTVPNRHLCIEAPCGVVQRRRKTMLVTGYASAIQHLCSHILQSLQSNF